ncbi:MAG: thiol oxidoreductase [Deltaproteobacteria bacterium]|nr:thiol oxidoreductase [Deltaproteobacteria bacterium]
MRRAAVALLIVAACGDEAALAPGGDTTIEDRTSQAYRLPAPNLDADALALHLDGDVAFEATFVTAPAPVNGGLGPVYNHTSCIGCHARDGRGLPQIGTGPTSQSLVRVSLAEGTPAVPGGAVPVPGVGAQLQDHAIFGAALEGTPTLSWTDVDGAYGDGAAYQLRAPQLAIAWSEEPEGAVMTSLRQPPPVFGLGLLEAIDEPTLTALADPDDRDGDGISGRVNYVWDAQLGRAMPGRFGLKANTPTLRQQAAAAYVNDMGVTNPMFPEDDGAIEIDAARLDATAFYTATLAVPARAAANAAANRGEQLFDQFRCTGCHVPTLVTGDSPIAAVAHQTIQPFTDLLVHDMGDGLADGRPDFGADGREWRTSPLWGIGLAETVLVGARYLHDGRARTLDEAILWHGGEAEAARERFRRASSSDRAALVAFLMTL